MLKELKRLAIEPIAPLLFASYFKKRGEPGALSISFDCDEQRDIDALPRVLDELGARGIKASFACVGMMVERNKKVHQRILDEGHEVINHSYSHPNGPLNPMKWKQLTPRHQLLEITKTQDLFQLLFDYTPVGWRTPHFGDQHDASVYPMLEKVGFLYSSSELLTRTQSHGAPYRVGNVLELPMMTCPAHYYPLFDTFHCYRTDPPAHPKPGEFARLFKRSAKYADSHDAVLCYYFDPQDCKTADFTEILDFLKGKAVTHEEIARRFA
jgi:hypothetical protein